MRHPLLHPPMVMLLAACGTTVPTEAQSVGDPFSYDRAAPLAIDTVRQADREGIRMYAISYASPDGGRVTGVLAVPPGSGRHAALLLMHGLPGDARGAMTALGLPAARRGAVALAIDAPWVRRGGLPDLTVRDSVEQVQLMRDLQRGVDLLVARDDVDPARIGYVGGSYGGAMGALFVGIERRLRAANLFVPDGGLVAHFTEADGTPTGPLAALDADAQARWIAAMDPIEPIRFVGRSSPTPLLIQSARQDQLVDRDDAEALQRAAAEPKQVAWYEAGHGLALFPAAARDRAAFLARELGIPVE